MTPYMKDAIERVAATFIVTALGVASIVAVPWLKVQMLLLAEGKVTDWRAILLVALVAGAAAAWDVLKVVLAKFTGDRQSASFVE